MEENKYNEFFKTLCELGNVATELGIVLSTKMIVDSESYQRFIVYCFGLPERRSDDNKVPPSKLEIIYDKDPLNYKFE